jgi:DNA-binding beta-propeller fold protein YncE
MGSGRPFSALRGGREGFMDPRNRIRAIALTVGLAAILLGFFASNVFATERDELERRLALPPFAYVGETDHDAAATAAGRFGDSGAAAYIDSASDSVVARPSMGGSLQSVAVAPSSDRVYMTDAYEPVLHVLDAESKQQILEIALPGVERHDPTAWTQKAFQEESGFLYADMRSCSGGVACTPDGLLVLVTSSAGLQVVDTETDRVVRTIPDLLGGSVAVSFDGKRAYVACDNFAELSRRSFFEWFNVFMSTEECRLVCLDLTTWKVIGEIPTALAGGIAVKPDDSQVFFSEIYRKRVRVVDALTLQDLWGVSTEPSYSIGIGFVPDAKKAYVVCSAESGLAGVVNEQTVPSVPTAQDFFCAVIDTARQEIVKRIPLEAY